MSALAKLTPPTLPLLLELRWSSEGLVGVGVTVGVAVGVSVTVAVGVGMSVGVSVTVAVGVSVGVSVGVADAVTIGVGVSVGVAVGVSVGINVGVAVAVGVGVGISVGNSVAVAVGVSVGVGRRVGRRGGRQGRRGCGRDTLELAGCIRCRGEQLPRFVQFGQRNRHLRFVGIVERLDEFQRVGAIDASRSEFRPAECHDFGHLPLGIPPAPLDGEQRSAGRLRRDQGIVQVVGAGQRDVQCRGEDQLVVQPVGVGVDRLRADAGYIKLPGVELAACSGAM
jgi:hypothetical protein